MQQVKMLVRFFVGVGFLSMASNAPLQAMGEHFDHVSHEVNEEEYKHRVDEFFDKLAQQNSMLSKSIIPKIKERVITDNVLDLSLPYVMKVPSEVGNLTKLEVFSLRRAKATHFPPEIGKLIHLKTIDLSYSQINNLPSEIGDLTNLESLSLINTPINRLPLSVGGLTKLKINVEKTPLKGITNKDIWEQEDIKNYLKVTYKK